MSNSVNIEAPKPVSSAKMLWAMVGIGIISALLIVSAYELTLPRIERLKAEALEKAVFKVLPGTVKTEAFSLNDSGQLIAVENGAKPASIIYAGFDDSGKLVGYAVQAGSQGYADVIRILYGYDPAKQSLVGFHVLESKETPGLGDRIEKDSGFLENFNGLDVGLNQDGQLKNKVITVKHGEKHNPWEIDAITGATISSRAVGNALGSSTMEMVPVLFQNYKKQLMARPIKNKKQ